MGSLRVNVLGYKSITFYLRQPTYMATKIVEQSEVQFPSITVCPDEKRDDGDYTHWDIMKKFEMRLNRRTEAAKSIRYTFRPSKNENWSKFLLIIIYFKYSLGLNIAM